MTVAALSFAYPAAVQAVPITYTYTGNPFTLATPPYTTSMFVTAMVTLAAPLGPNFSGNVSPTDFTFFDGVQSLTPPGISSAFFFFETGPAGEITAWRVGANTSGIGTGVRTQNQPGQSPEDRGLLPSSAHGLTRDDPGSWAVVGAVPDTGSTLSLMTLTLMALGLMARRFQRRAV